MTHWARFLSRESGISIKDEDLAFEDKLCARKMAGIRVSLNNLEKSTTEMKEGKAGRVHVNVKDLELPQCTIPY
jgi:hypothetical protein